MELPVFDLSPYLERSSRDACDTPTEEVEPLPSTSGSHRDYDLNYSLLKLCQDLATCLKEAGAIVVRDPRCSTEDNQKFLDMMERYFSQADEVKQQHARPEYHYQVGVTPEGIEVPRCAVDHNLQAAIREQPEENRAHVPAGADPKWRYMWRVGPRPDVTKFKELNAEPVVPAGFPEWADVMDGWGHKMIAAVEAVAEMAALGFGLPPAAFTSLMRHGPHLLAPTGSDLARHGRRGTVFAGYHYDLNFLTIHGKSLYPGLHIWLSDGRKVPVSVPEGCLLLQAGKQLEWLTGGVCRAGMHEVVVTDSTLAAAEAARRRNGSLWRVSSTVFGHVASDAELEPLGHFAQSESAHRYPRILAGKFVEAELAAINLRQNEQNEQEQNDPRACLITSEEQPGTNLPPTGYLTSSIVVN
eukprot:jgi/Mesen1/6922/ME000358S06248